MVSEIYVENTRISVIKIHDEDYICITDMIKGKDGEFFISNWIRNRNTLEYIGVWESIHNPNFNYVEFDTIRIKAGLNNFRISVKDFIDKTQAICLRAKPGRYGGTYAHKDIAFEFGMWISPQFKIYLVTEFQRLKDEENKMLGWSAKRELAKINYRIHTSAIKNNLIPPTLTPNQIRRIYADEADVLNMALFGITAADWRNSNPTKPGNIRDYANIDELICLSNMENINAVFIKDGMKQSERLEKLNKIAISQMKVLRENHSTKLLKKKK